jgi:hypothetical protein
MKANLIYTVASGPFHKFRYVKGLSPNPSPEERGTLRAETNETYKSVIN